VSPSQYFEQFLYNPATIHQLLQASGFSDTQEAETPIKAMLFDRSQLKVLELAQQSFYSRLELDLFGCWDPRGKESILQMQERLAKVSIPHDMPNQKDTTAMVEIVNEYCSNRLGHYRYLWGDAMAATFWKEGQDDEMVKQILLSNGHDQAVQKLMMDSPGLWKSGELDKYHVDIACLINKYNLDDDDDDEEAE
jgi:Zn-dependent oligopeptidase